MTFDVLFRHHIRESEYRHFSMISFRKPRPVSQPRLKKKILSRERDCANFVHRFWVEPRDSHTVSQKRRIIDIVIDFKPRALWSPLEMTLSHIRKRLLVMRFRYVNRYMRRRRGPGKLFIFFITPRINANPAGTRPARRTSVRFSGSAHRNWPDPFRFVSVAVDTRWPSAGVRAHERTAGAA